MTTWRVRMMGVYFRDPLRELAPVGKMIGYADSFSQRRSSICTEKIGLCCFRLMDVVAEYRGHSHRLLSTMSGSEGESTAFRFPTEGVKNR